MENKDKKLARKELRKDSIRVLIVDDSLLICRSISKMLSGEEDINFEYCTDPEKAVELSRQFAPTVILQDLNMPNVHGFDLLRQYRGNPLTPNVPVLILSSEEDPTIKAKAFALGANDYLLKSNKKVEFLARIRYHAQRFQNLKKNESAMPSSLASSKHTIKILVVASSKVLLKFIKMAIDKDKDIILQSCSDPNQVIKVADDFLPTVILQSFNIGKSNGLEMLASFRGNPSTKDVPIIIFSSNQDAEQKAKVFESGANDYIIKSEDSLELISRIKNHSREYYNQLKGEMGTYSQTSGESEITKVFMIDDSKITCRMVAQHLGGEENAAFSFCNDPVNAIKSAKKFSPTVILLDLHMPQIDGLELLRNFREDPNTCDIPIIMLSASSDSTIKAKAFGLGANDFMEKKAGRVELISRIHYHSKAYLNSNRLAESVEKLLEAQKRMELQKNFIRKTFGRYLSDDIVNSILESPQGLELGGEKREVTIMMTDLRGFTSLSEKLSPEDVLTIINNYLKEMTDILFKYQGTIDEFIGDAILAIFGAPLHNEKHAEVAVACALEMQVAMKKVNEINQKMDLPEVEMGIGLNTGEVVVGNIGSEKRAKYGVIGKNVNLTSRIESYTTGGQVFISEKTMENVRDIAKVRGEITVEPKGVKTPITIYDICGIGGKHNISLPEEKLDFQNLAEPIAISFALIEGKSKNKEEFSGTFIELSKKGAVICSEKKMEPLKNIRITLKGKAGRRGLDMDIFAKVLQVDEETQSTFIVRFTYLDAGPKKCLEQYLTE